MHPKTILLVEDEALIALSQARQLQKEGYAVVHAYSGEAAIAQVRAAQPPIDLILMDINLGPGLDGTQAAQIILQDHDLPVVFLSSHTEPEVVAKTEKITSYGYVAKETGITVLAASIKMAFKLHAARQALQRANDSLGLALTASRAGTWDWDIVHDTFLWSPEFLEIFGLPPGTVAGFEAWTQAVHPEDRDGAARRIQDAIDARVELVNDYRIVLPDGSIRWIRATGRTYYDDSRPLRMAGLCMDITEHKQAEEALRKSQSRLVEAQRIAGLGNWEWDARTDRVTWSKELYALARLDENLPAPTYAEHPRFYTDDSMRRLGEAVEQAMQTGRPYELDLEMVCADGSRKWLSARGEAVYDNAGQCTGLRGTVLDITARKRTEEALRNSEEKFSKVFQHAPLMLAISDLQTGVILDVNQNHIEISGYTRQELIGKTSLELGWISPEDRTRLSSILQAQEYVQAQELIVWTKDRRPISCLYGGVMVDIGGQPRIISITQDITERKRAEEALRKSEARFRSIFEKSASGYVLTALDGSLLQVNAAMADMLGYAIEELRQANFRDITHPEDIAISVESVRSLLAGEQEHDTYRFEKRYLHRNGATVWTMVNTTLVRDDQNAPLYFVTGITDITERKRAENDLRTSEQRFQKTLEILPVGVWIADQNGTIVHGNPAGRTIWAGARYVGPDQFHEYKAWRVATGEPIEPEAWGVTRAIRQGEASSAEEIEIECFDGTHKIILNWVVPILGPHQEIEGAVAVNQDITERKQAEQALQQALAEKETLMAEFQHRVKNSLAAAAGLLSVERDSLPDAGARVILANAEARLHTIAALYEQLNEASRIDRVELRSYLRALVEKVSRAYLRTEGPVTVDACLGAIEIDTRRAVMLGLIVNELVANALKHAFPDGRPGVIRIELEENAGQVMLTVADDGVGLAPGGSRPGLGLALIESLARQLKGKLAVESNRGVRAQLLFNGQAS